jgi:hypothetical protein
LAVDELRILAEPWRVQREKEEEERRSGAAGTWEEDTAVTGKEGIVPGGFPACSGLHRTIVGISNGVEEHNDFDAGTGEARGAAVSELLRGLEKRIEELRKRAAR